VHQGAIEGANISEDLLLDYDGALVLVNELDRVFNGNNLATALTIDDINQVVESGRFSLMILNSHRRRRGDHLLFMRSSGPLRSATLNSKPETRNSKRSLAFRPVLAAGGLHIRPPEELICSRVKK